VSVSSVRGTEFRTAFDELTGRGATEVLNGVVEVARTGEVTEAVLEPGQGAAVTDGNTLKVTLLPPPDLEAPDQIQSGRSLAFAVRALPDAAGYRGRLATDAGMVEAFAETASAPGQSRLAFNGIPDGPYFLRLTAVSGAGIEGLPITYDVLRIRNLVTDLAYSAERIGRRRFYRFRWREEGDGKALFRFQIWRESDPSMTPVIDQPGLTDTALTLASLPAGAYSWRVQAARASLGRRVESWSEVQRLRISR
jgi:hypothetical protein